ncbi:MAG TPA: hypothetical protein VGF84_06665 [Micromonosporaceae bacterium]|jgi:hypothetical protein
MSADGDFDAILARVRGPLSIEAAQLDAEARGRWEAYAATHGWHEIDWFDMPGAFAWRRQPPGVWEMTWQRSSPTSELFDVRLLPPEHSLVWRRQLIGFVRDLGLLLGRAITLRDDSTATGLIDLDPADGRLRRARTTPPKPIDRPPGQLCCVAMRQQFADECDICFDAAGCPHQLIYFNAKSGDLGLPVRDGGSTYVAITHCPWCGRGVSGTAAYSDAG